MSPEQLHRARVVGRDGCCMMRALGEAEDCDGRLQAAHVPPKASTKTFRRNQVHRLKHGDDLPDDLRALAELSEFELVADGDLGLALCARHHRLWDLRGVRLPRELLPYRIEQRCRELGMTRLLDELLGPLPGEPDMRAPGLRGAA